MSSKLAPSAKPIGLSKIETTAESPHRSPYLILGVIAANLIFNTLFVTSLRPPPSIAQVPEVASFYYRISEVRGLCSGVTNRTVSHAGHIGLEGDSEESPKHSFFWHFEAENDARNAPVMSVLFPLYVGWLLHLFSSLTVGGGPGTSGMMNPLVGQLDTHDSN
ncbi:hypothetical protein B0H13DRAFT_2355678 [Mycena leptocephala]|nr:hypothetical protein B0H13DRAFT_2355678 [Mycena leptocephala]